MKIQICATGFGGIAVTELQRDLHNLTMDTSHLIDSFKVVQNRSYDLNGGVGNLRGALDDIDTRLWQEEATLQAAEDLQKDTEDFLQLAQRIDRQVAADVDKNTAQWYQKYPHLAPKSTGEKICDWGEDALNWLCDRGQDIADGFEAAWDWAKDAASDAWDWVKDTASKAWKWTKENWDVAVTIGVSILCAVGSVIAIALIPVTGGASVLLIAGISALSGAIIAGVQSATSQYKRNGEINWTTVLKESGKAAVIGAVTGAIGAGVGNAITSGLSNTGIGATLLNSSSTAVRMTTGAVIGSSSEVASGMLTRGAAEATESYMETGSVKFGDVWDAATDPKQMLVDAAIGGASGGASSAKKPESQSALDVDSATAQSADIDSGEKPTYTTEEVTSLRKKAVANAWENERELVLQGKGTRDWTPSQQAELIEHGRVTGFEGQHMKNVDAFPEFAGDPNNIQFLTPAEHYYGAHSVGYDKPRYGNPTNGRFDPSTGTMIPFGEGEHPSMPVINLSSTVDPSQVDFLEKLGRPFGYGRYEDNMAGYHRIHPKKTP